MKLKVKWKRKIKTLEGLKDGDFIVLRGCGDNRPRKIRNIKIGELFLQWDEYGYAGGQVYHDPGHEYPINLVVPLLHAEAAAMQTKHGVTNYPESFFIVDAVISIS